MIYDNLTKILDYTSKKAKELEKNKSFIKYFESFVSLVALYGDATVVKDDIENFKKITIDQKTEDINFIENLIAPSVLEMQDFDEEGNFRITKDKNIDMFLCSLTVGTLLEDIQDSLKVFFWLSNSRDHLSFIYKTKNNTLSEILLAEIIIGDYSIGEDFLNKALKNVAFKFKIDEDFIHLLNKLNNIYKEEKTERENFEKISSLFVNIIRDRIISGIKFQTDDDGNVFFENGIYIDAPEIVKTNGFITVECTRYRKKVDENGKLLLEKVVEKWTIF